MVVPYGGVGYAARDINTRKVLRNEQGRPMSEWMYKLHTHPLPPSLTHRRRLLVGTANNPLRYQTALTGCPVDYSLFQLFQPKLILGEGPATAVLLDRATLANAFPGISAIPRFVARFIVSLGA